MIKEIILFALCSLLLAPSSVVEAQQPTIIPRIGFLPSEGDASNPGTQIKTSSKGYAILAISTGRTSSSSLGMSKGKWPLS